MSPKAKPSSESLRHAGSTGAINLRGTANIKYNLRRRMHYSQMRTVSSIRNVTMTLPQHIKLRAPEIRLKCRCQEAVPRN